ncbi:MAG: hypothetical protein CM1200mP9_03890 [Gammaproteobacteria bacterium]|nr:MAG: hypothetical protein CM1200mP9_03890 [Gammaproteobacteria bacterium]
MSNAFGTINPIENIIDLAHSHDAEVLVDGAQAAAHLPSTSKRWVVTFTHSRSQGLRSYWDRNSVRQRISLDAMPPWQAGGEMIEEVRLAGTTYQSLPYKLRPGHLTSRAPSAWERLLNTLND